ncbi:MAG: hypothetical protein JSV61_09625 [Anaerolineales bacterium]|nr:MAG: hypothetical protein JSV61_09625 [Anaerolineales bacterium]
MNNKNKNILLSLLLILPTLLLTSSCDDLRNLFSRYTQVTVLPETIATFSYYNGRECTTSPTHVDTDAIPPPPAQFQGIGVAAVGHSGLFNPRNRHEVHTMQTAIKFDLENAGIPAESFNETMIANLVFTYNLTERSASNSSCNVPISRPSKATISWDSDSNFGRGIPERIFSMVGCDLISGSRTDGAYNCLVSEAVIDWMRDSATNPNNGFVINPPYTMIDSCSTEIGEPGNRLECVLELSNIGLNIQYIAP